VGAIVYLCAVCKGIDDIPAIDDEIRTDVRRIYEEYGIEEVRRRLRLVDPQHYGEVDLRNVKRMLHALEVCYQTGRRFSEIRTNSVKQRSFKIVKIGVCLPRELLYERINRRVNEMIEQGLYQEAISVYDRRHLNALNTVGYKEMFSHIEGEYGIRIENTLLTVPYRSTAFGEFLQFTSLTLCPIDTAPIVLSMLSAEEITWLNDYHRMVYTTLAPHLDREHLVWLKEATKPLELGR